MTDKRPHALRQRDSRNRIRRARNSANNALPVTEASGETYAEKNAQRSVKTNDSAPSPEIERRKKSPDSPSTTIEKRSQDMSSIYDDIDIEIDDSFLEDDELEILRSKKQGSSPAVSGLSSSEEHHKELEQNVSSSDEEDDDDNFFDEYFSDSSEETLVKNKYAKNQTESEQDVIQSEYETVNNDVYEEESFSSSALEEIENTENEVEYSEEDDDEEYYDDEEPEVHRRLSVKEMLAQNRRRSGVISSSVDGEVDDEKDPFAADDKEDPFVQLTDEEVNEYAEEETDPFAADDDDNVSGSAGIFEDDFAADEDDEPTAGQSVFRGYDINAIIAVAFEEGASDIHINANKGIFFRNIVKDMERKHLFGSIKPDGTSVPPDARTTKEMQLYVTNSVLSGEFVVDKELDTSYVVQLEKDTTPKYRDLVEKYRGRRLRLSLGTEDEDVFLVFRTITDKIGKPEEYGIKGEMLDWLSMPQGLIMVNGPTGSGKSTTLASLVRQEQLRSQKKIITIEKPVEFMYPDDGETLIVQREVGKDTRSFQNGLTSAMRQDPDIILIGEARNEEEVSALLYAAETGHLTLTTMHTNTVAGTISRIKLMYKGDEQAQVLMSLSDYMQGIVNQMLLRRADGKGVFSIREQLNVNQDVRRLIAKGDVEGIRNYQRKRRETMEQKLVEAALSGRCTVDLARIKSDSKEEFDDYYVNDIIEGRSDGSEAIYESIELEEYYNDLLEKRNAGNSYNKQSEKNPRGRKSLPIHL